MRSVVSCFLQALLLVLLILPAACSKKSDDGRQIIPPKLILSDTILNFDSTRTQLPLTISNGGSDTIVWSVIIGNISWISATPSSGHAGSSKQLILVQVNRDILPWGQNSQDIYIATTNSGFKKVTIKAYKPDKVKDISGNTYTIIKIGSQLWLKENLKTKLAPNGTPIAYYYPGGNSNNFKEFGLLYRWDVAMNGDTSIHNQGICPDGWRIPNDNDWNILINFAGGMSSAGGALKDTGTMHWQSPNTGATNSTGFTAVAAGDRWNTGEYAMFLTDGIFWSATSYSNSTDVMCWSLRNYDITGFTVHCYPDNAISVRCIKN